MAFFHIFLLTLLAIMGQAQPILGNTDKEIFLEKQNEARANVGVAPLTWDENLAAYARNFANLAKGGCSPMKSGGSYGENVAAGYGMDYVLYAVNSWITEMEYYDHQSNRCLAGKECRHYTQVVWRDTTRVGCASVTCGGGWPFHVCEYYPRGNVPGKRPY